MPRGIPHSIFLGRPMPAPGEPMWLPEDTAKVLAWLRYESTLCKDCRTAERDWWDEDGNKLTEPKYEFSTRRCPGCQNFTVHWEAVKKMIGDDVGQMAGLLPCFVPFGTKRRRALDDDDDW